MGQRHQIIVIYPKMFLNQDNPNNKPERAEVIHHQWLYGMTAILSLERVLKLASNSWDGNETDYLFGRGDRGYASGSGTAAIAATVSVDPESGYYHHVSVWEDADWNEMENNYTSPNNLAPDMFDNNDGITVIKFEVGEKLPQVCFTTPSHLEGSHWIRGKGPWTAAEYLKFYYSTAEQSKWDAETKARMTLALENVQKLSRPISKAELKKLLPKFFRLTAVEGAS